MSESTTERNAGAVSMGLVSIGEFGGCRGCRPRRCGCTTSSGCWPARVDAETGYRWYAARQLEQARLVASLRRVGVPRARIREVLALEPAAAAEEIRAYWAGAEAEHAAQRSWSAAW